MRRERAGGNSRSHSAPPHAQQPNGRTQTRSAHTVGKEAGTNMGRQRSRYAKRAERTHKNLFKVFLELHKWLAGMGCKAQRAANSPCYWQALQRRRPPGQPLARRVGVNSADWKPRLLAWAQAHAAHPKHPLIPIALQCNLPKDFEQVLRPKTCSLNKAPNRYRLLHTLITCAFFHALFDPK